MNLESIAQYLQDEQLGVMGRSIFVNAMPATVTEGVLLLPPYGGTPINHYIPGYYHSDFRLVARAVDFARAQTLARSCSIALDKNQAVSMGDVRVTRCMPMNLPRPYRPSDGGYIEMEVDFDIWFTQVDA